MEFTSCLYTTQGDYVCQDTVERFYNPSKTQNPLMTQPVVQQRLRSCYTNNEFNANSPTCLSHIHHVASALCRNPANKSPVACGVSSTSGLTACSDTVRGNATEFAKRLQTQYPTLTTMQAMQPAQFQTTFQCVAKE